MITNIIKTILPRSIGPFLFFYEFMALFQCPFFFSHNFVVLQFSKNKIVNVSHQRRTVFSDSFVLPQVYRNKM